MKPSNKLPSTRKNRRKAVRNTLHNGIKKWRHWHCSIYTKRIRWTIFKIPSCQTL